ncbi:MAG: hypothetical protein ACE5GH_02575 [Fidelibacterota bacterium]
MKLRPVGRLPGRGKLGGLDPQWTLLVFVTMVLMLGIWIGIFLENREQEEKSKTDATQVFSIATMEVARNFTCPCGSCSDRSLVTCQCPTATSTKRFIETNLSDGQSPEDGVEIVKRVYGHYKG